MVQFYSVSVFFKKYILGNLGWEDFPKDIYQVANCHDTYNLDHNILKLFDALPNFPLTTSETNCDY